MNRNQIDRCTAARTLRVGCMFFLMCLAATVARAQSADDAFAQGCASYEAGNYADAAQQWEAVSGTFSAR